MSDLRSEKILDKSAKSGAKLDDLYYHLKNIVKFSSITSGSNYNNIVIITNIGVNYRYFIPKDNDVKAAIERVFSLLQRTFCNHNIYLIHIQVPLINLCYLRLLCI